MKYLIMNNYIFRGFLVFELVVLFRYDTNLENWYFLIFIEYREKWY